MKCDACGITFTKKYGLLKNGKQRNHYCQRSCVMPRVGAASPNWRGGISKKIDYQKLWKLNNPDKVKLSNLRFYDLHVRNNKDAREKRKEYRKTERQRRLHRERQIRLLKENTGHRLSSNMGRLMRQSIKDKKKRHWEIIAGYSLNDLMNHLESQFKEGMSWDNYGSWHIDHIIPISSWNLKSVQQKEFKDCWGLNNLQPLWALDNIRKGNKVEI